MAAKLRGMLNALDLVLMGRSLRGAMLALTARQYWEHRTEVTVSLNEAFWYIKHVLLTQEPRIISVWQSERRPVLVCTDASLEGGVLRLGSVVLCPNSQPGCTSHVVS
eukprot:5799015-Karenia_brevis.AAC.1